MMHNQVAERKRLEGNIQHFSVSTEKQNQKRAERPPVMATAVEERNRKWSGPAC